MSSNPSNECSTVIKAYSCWKFNQIHAKPKNVKPPPCQIFSWLYPCRGVEDHHHVLWNDLPYISISSLVASGPKKRGKQLHFNWFQGSSCFDNSAVLRGFYFSLVPLHSHNNTWRLLMASFPNVHHLYNLIVCLFEMIQPRSTNSCNRLSVYYCLLFSFVVHWSPQVTGSSVNNVCWHDPLSNARRHECTSRPDGSRHELSKSRIEIKEFCNASRDWHVVLIMLDSFQIWCPV